LPEEENIMDESEVKTLNEALEAEKAAHEQTRTQLALIEAAYRHFVPTQFIKLMGADSILRAQPGMHAEQSLTILFSDIRNFTTLSESMSPEENFRFLNSYLREMEPVIRNSGGFIDKFIGDAIMALFSGCADDALQAAIRMQHKLEAYNQGRDRARYGALRIGIGLNSGITMLGTVGGEGRMDSTVIGDTVNLAARLETVSKTYGVALLISEHTLYGLADPLLYHIRLIDRIRVKGKIHPQSVHEVFDADPVALREAKRSTLIQFEEAIACYHLREVERAKTLFLKCIEMVPEDSVAVLYLERCERFLATGVHEGTGELDLIPAWRDEYSIGVPEVDAQHKELLRQIHKLSDCFREGRKLDVQEILKFLAGYAVHHFSTEEKLMQKSNYPFTVQHIREHQTFVKYFTKLCQEIELSEPNSTYVTFRIQLLLVDWLINHTTKTDRHLGVYLLNKDVAEPAPGFVA
jgi:hemerythrin